MSRRFSWEEPKDAQQTPRGADALRRNIARISDAVADELADLQRRIERARTADLVDDEFGALLSLARLHEIAGAFEEATDAAQQAAALARSLGDPVREVDALSTVAVTWGRRGDPAYALEVQAQISACRSEGPEHNGIAATLINTAVARIALNELSVAVELLDDAFRMARGGDDPLSSGQVLNNVAAVRMLEHRYDEAERLLQRAILLRQRSADHRGLAHTYNNLGLVHAKTGDLVGAIPFLEMASVLLADVGDLPSLVFALSNNILVFEQHYLDPAHVLRRSFGDATTALSARLPAPAGDANVVRLLAAPAPSGFRVIATEWEVVAEGTALLSTQVRER